MDLSVIIVSWKVKEKLRDNLTALFASEGDFSFEVYVVDNDSQDGTIEMLKTEFPQVNLIANDKNLGFAKANNQAMRLAKGDYILLLNPDMRVNKDTLVNSLKGAKNNPQAVVLSCKLMDQEGRLIRHVRRFPSLFDQLMVVLKVPHILPSVLNNYLYADFDYKKESKVDSVRGAYFLINKKSWQDISKQDLPLLDERYFIWFEEVDFCKQVYEHGGEVWYFPEASCLDYIGSSFKQVNVSVKQNYFKESMIAYFKKWHSSGEVLLLKCAWVIGAALAKIFTK